jgi:hypothetical protein
LTSESEQQLKAGIAIFVGMSSKLGLVCSPTASSRRGSPVQFDLSNGSTELRLTLGYDFVTDLPCTKEFQQALWMDLSAITLRLTDQNLAEFTTLSGIPIRFRIEFPFSRSTEGGSFEFVHVLTESGARTVFEAKFSVHLTHTVAVQVASLESVITEPLVVNAVRTFIDTNQAVFYPQRRHPIDLQVLTIESSAYDYKEKRFVYHAATDEQIAEFLKRKTYWLGFRRGKQSTRICIADPYDAAYLGVSAERLVQAGAILAAEGYLQTDSSGLYANAGNRLLAQAHRFDREFAAFFKTETAAEEDILLPSNILVSTGNPLFDVFISHATEDKPYVEPLVEALEAAGIKVWFDKTALEWGDDLRPSIDRGLANCRYGIVVLSKAFLRKKKWTEYELNSLFALEQPGRKIILPIWHGITRDDLLQYGAGFADRLAKISSKDSYEDIVESLLNLVGRSKPQTATTLMAPLPTVPEPAKPNPDGADAPRVAKLELPAARPMIVPKRYGKGVLKDHMGYTGLAVVNDGEQPAYDITIHNVQINEGGKLTFHCGHTERLTKNDGEAFYPAFVEMRLGGIFGSGLFDFMRERGVVSITVPITYRDSSDNSFQTDVTLERDVQKSGGLRLGWKQKRIRNPDSENG